MNGFKMLKMTFQLKYFRQYSGSATNSGKMLTSSLRISSCPTTWSRNKKKVLLSRKFRTFSYKTF